MIIVGEKIKACRLKKGWSQGDLATRVLVSRQSVSKWENNITIPDIEKLVALSQLFDITLDELILAPENTNAALDQTTTIADEQGQQATQTLKKMLWVQTSLLVLLTIVLVWLLLI